ncbi:hypothetical protein BpHYR1_006315, partial [Brachionus plicatilis]
MHSVVNRLDSFSEQDKIDHKVSGDNLIKTPEVKQTPEHKLVDYSDSESIVSIVEDFHESKEESVDLVLTKTNRNNTKIIYESNEFIFEKKYKNKLYWKCLVFEPVQ